MPNYRPPETVLRTRSARLRPVCRLPFRSRKSCTPLKLASKKRDVSLSGPLFNLKGNMSVSGTNGSLRRTISDSGDVPFVKIPSASKSNFVSDSPNSMLMRVSPGSAPCGNISEVPARFQHRQRYSSWRLASALNSNPTHRRSVLRCLLVCCVRDVSYLDFDILRPSLVSAVVDGRDFERRGRLAAGIVILCELDSPVVS